MRSRAARRKNRRHLALDTLVKLHQPGLRRLDALLGEHALLDRHYHNPYHEHDHYHFQYHYHQHYPLPYIHLHLDLFNFNDDLDSYYSHDYHP